MSDIHSNLSDRIYRNSGQVIITGNGDITMKPRADSTMAVVFQNAAGETVASLDTVLGDFSVPHHISSDVENVYNVRSRYGSIGDATAHPLSERYATLADAQAVYPFATSLTQEIDYCAIQAAIIDANANSGGVVFLPSGVYITPGGHTPNPGTIIRGAVRNLTFVQHTGNNTCFAVTGTGGTSMLAGADFQDFTLLGNSGASAKGIVICNNYKSRFHNLIVQGYSAGIGVQLSNATGYTEGALFDNTEWRGNYRSVQLARNSGSGTSFAETSFRSCSIVLTVADSTGVDIPDSGSVVYGGVWNIKYNNEVSGGTCIKVGAGVLVYKNQYELYVETQPAMPCVYLSCGANSFFTGDGYFIRDSEADATASIVDSAKVFFGKGDQVFAVGRECQYLVQAAESTVSSDGDVVIAYSTGMLLGTFHLHFEGPNREHDLMLAVQSGNYATNPSVIVLSEWVFNGQPVFGNPFIKRLVDGTSPHLIIPISNRNAGTDLQVTWISTKRFAHQIALLPSAAAGTLGAADTNTGNLKAFGKLIGAGGIESDGNITVGSLVAGATANKTIVLSNSATAPTTSVDLVHLYGSDRAAGAAALSVYQEAAVEDIGANAADKLIPVRWNGVNYKILAKAA
jgi:hypothetical protein